GCGTTNPTIQIPPSTTPAGNQSGPNPGGSPTNTPSSPGSPTSNPSPTETCTPTSGNPNNSGGSSSSGGPGAPSGGGTGTPPPGGNDQLHITYAGTLANISLADYLKTKDPPTLLLARVAIGEAIQDNTTDISYIIWEVKIRTEIGFSNYRAGYYKNGPLPKTDIQTELFNIQNGKYQYSSLTDPQGGIIYDDYNATSPNSPKGCGWSHRRMANPCDGNDTNMLKYAWDQAQNIMSSDINKAPEAIKGYDSHLSSESRGTYCGWGDFKDGYNKKSTTFGSTTSRFYGCVFPDDIIFFGKPPDK
ncbi:MAG: hypothetical protein P4L50_11180, partial [Anaerolineaceae bacterium]|nr:hypothetical protein [Anaerolineaceae bacterium]